MWGNDHISDMKSSTLNEIVFFRNFTSRTSDYKNSIPTAIVT
jgi:hypothetical protein